MTAFDLSRTEELAAYEERFLGTLEFTLSWIFNADPTLASSYLSNVVAFPPLQRALALHEDPLDVASALTGFPITTQRIAAYEAMKDRFEDTLTKRSLHREILEDRIPQPDILARGPRDDGSPLVPLSTVNKIMSDLGYSKLIVRSGVAYFALRKRNRPLPVEYRMESLPGETEDRVPVYSLDRVVVALRAMREFARRTRPASTILTRIDKMIDFLIRQTFG